MIGKYQLQLGADQLVTGMASSDYATDGALGTSSTNLNPFATPGVMYGLASGVDAKANVAGKIIASAEDSQSVAANDRLLVDNAGNYYFINGTTVTLKKTATTNAAFYVQGKTDMVSYAGNTYVTTANGDIDLFNSSGATTLTNSWWVTTKSQPAMNTSAPHPMLQYFNHLYVADANKIHSINSSQTIDTDLPALPLTLNTNDYIQALATDPSTGLMMISIQTTINFSDALTSKFYVGLWDGVSANLTRRIPVDDLITAFHSLEGQVYIGMGQTIGVWNGVGVTFLRKLKNVALTSTDLIYKHHFANTRNILHVVDGNQILSYGAVTQKSGKAFFYTASPIVGTSHLTAVIPLPNNTFGIAYFISSTYYLDVFDLSSTAGSTNGSMYFNNTYLPRPIYIRRVRIITTGVTTNNGIGGVRLFDEKNNFQDLAITTFKVASAASPKYVFDFDYTMFKLQAIQLRVTFDTQGFGFVRGIIYYDIAE